MIPDTENTEIDKIRKQKEVAVREQRYEDAARLRMEERELMSKLKENKLFIAYYNPCTHESCSGVISIHRTKKGAESAIKAHKEADRLKNIELYELAVEYEKHNTIEVDPEEYRWPMEWQHWHIEEVNILD